MSVYRESLGDLEGAFAAAQAAVDLRPEVVDSQVRRAELLVMMGDAANDATKIEAGRDAISRSLSSEPRNVPALLVLAKLQILDGDLDAAAATLKSSLSELLP